MLGDTWGDAHSLADTVDDSLVEMEAETLSDTVSDAHAVVKSRADTVREVAK